MLEHPCCYLFYLFKFNLNCLILGIICNLVLTNLKILLLLNLLLMMLEKFSVTGFLFTVHLAVAKCQWTGKICSL